MVATQGLWACLLLGSPPKKTKEREKKEASGFAVGLPLTPTPPPKKKEAPSLRRLRPGEAVFLLASARELPAVPVRGPGAAGGGLRKPQAGRSGWDASLGGWQGG